MRDKFKKLTSMIAAAALCATVVSFAGCSDNYSTKVPGDDIFEGEVVSNGGFVVEKGNYVYFINGAEEYTASNKYGEVVKGALMRLSKSDLENKNYDNAVTVVPSLFVAQNFDAGIYIYGDYVYYASPTTEKDQDGNVQNDWISFKRAKLDGSEAMKDYYFRSDDNALDYRFVEVDDVVYCLYVDDSTLYSYNTQTRTDTVLVSGAGSEFFFDSSDPENPTVYYTMGVTQDVDSASSFTVPYTQLYSVRADAQVEKVDASKASYTIKGGKTYSFDRAYLEDNLDGFDASDYTTYPYVNLGELVLDGKGSSTAQKQTQFNDDTSTPATPDGYTYTIQSYQNDGIYFTRTNVNKTSSDGENSKLYYLSDEAVSAADWKTIAGNQGEEIDTVALNTTNASTSALFYIENGTHYYIYASDTKVYRNKANDDGTVAESLLMIPKAESAPTLWKTEGDYLYYYATGTNGNNLSRINYKGTEEDYNPLLLTEEYKPAKILDVDWNSSWYKPEFIGTDLFFSNAQSFGSTSYNYIYVVSLAGENGIMNAEELKAFNDKYEEVTEYIDEFSSNNADLQTALKYYFRTGETKYFEENLQEAKDAGYRDYYLYSEYAIEEFRAFTEKRLSTNKGANDYSTMFDADKGDAYYGVESYFMNMVGELKESDEEAINEAWKDSLKNIPEETEEGWATWQKVLLGVGIAAGVLIVAAAIAIPVIFHVRKKRKAEADREATKVKKPVIDTTDDKSIDVYADDAAENAVGSEAEKAPADSDSVETEETSSEINEAEVSEPSEADKKDE